jgi:hypothetical protein
MTYLEALDLVTAQTGHTAYRQLCRDSNPDAAQRDGYRALVVSLATRATPGAAPRRPTVTEAWAMVRARPRTAADCGCGGRA